MNTIYKLLIGSIFIIGIYLAFSISKLVVVSDYAQKIKNINSQKTLELNRLETELSENTSELENISQELNKIKSHNLLLESSNEELAGEVAGLTTERELNYPFAVPTNGTIGNFAGNYGGNMMGMRHFGVDIWTSLENNGMIAGHVGNPVFSACDGIVDNTYEPNGGVTIKCDPINGDYNIPDNTVYTYYGHMGNADTKQQYRIVSIGQRVNKGQQIGYQGDLSSYFPEMRNVHLHFSVFGGLSETDKREGAYNPCIYIGGDCTMQGSTFSV